MRHGASIVVLAAACVTLSGGPAGPSSGTVAVQAQSLGDLARTEEERRKAVTPGKVYTNDNLRNAPAPPPPVAATPAPASSEATPSSPTPEGAPSVATVKKDEAYWRGRVQGERDAQERAKVLLAALQSRVNGLQTDFVNRDDPAQRNVIFTERQRALAELERLGREIQQHTKAVADIQEEARRAGAPAAWYR
jgi:hypothetical protein